MIFQIVANKLQVLKTKLDDGDVSALAEIRNTVLELSAPPQLVYPLRDIPDIPFHVPNFAWRFLFSDYETHSTAKIMYLVDRVKSISTIEKLITWANMNKMPQLPMLRN